MKPMNFPERRNQRRKEALVRLEEALSVPQEGKDEKMRVRNLKKAIENTEKKIIQGSRFGEQSKIRRTGKR